MLPIYENTESTLEIHHQKSRHISPHLHKSLECVYVTEGSLELGICQELFHMETGDFAIVFPELIHHYQVFCSSKSTAVYLLASPFLSGTFSSALQQFCPANPVISSKLLHPDISYAIYSLLNDTSSSDISVLHQAFFQIILARSFPCFHLIEKSSMGSNDIIYRAVSYIAAHFRESVTLSCMAHDLGCSPYVLSRVFSGTFHRNFNQYLNSVRLDYACALLKHTSQPITEILLNSGFESQRTFNRVFREFYHMSPREYRQNIP